MTPDNLTKDSIVWNYAIPKIYPWQSASTPEIYGRSPGSFILEEIKLSAPPKEVKNMTNCNIYTVIEPGKIDNLVLPEKISLIVDEWLLELQCDVNILQKYKIERRKSLLFHGQPGCGKTSLAKNIATKLNRPICIAKLAGIEHKYVGESEKNLVELFTQAQQNNMVLFMDEIDCMASNRDEELSSQHYKNMTITLLNEIDNFKGTLIGATNRPKAIDDAIWRRFDLHLEIPAPDSKAIQKIIKNYFLPFEISDIDIGSFAALLEGVGASLVKQLVNGIKRIIVLSEQNNLPADIETVLTRVAASVTPPLTQNKCNFWNAQIRKDFLNKMQWPLTLGELVCQ